MPALIYRYSLPGLPISLALYLILLNTKIGISVPEIVGIPIIIAFSLLVGHFVQQLWMLLFEKWPWSYKSNTRKALIEIERILSESKDKTLKGYFANEHPYNIWDTMLYAKIFEAEIRDKDRGMWNSYHTNFGNAIGLVVGAVALYFVPNITSLLPDGQLFWVIGACIATAVILACKAQVTRNLVEDLEAYWVRVYFLKYARDLIKTNPRK